MKRLIALTLCLLMLVAATACNKSPAHDHDHDPEVPPVSHVQTVPTATNAAGSIFIGDWSVSAQVSPLNKLTFLEAGTLRAYFGESTLGGVFLDDGSKLTLYISQKTLEGTYTVDGDTITVTTADDVLVFTKI